MFTDSFKSLRIQRNLTQADLAEELGVSRSAVAMWERGEREPDFESLELIADFFNVTMASLIGEKPLPAPRLSAAAYRFAEMYDRLSDDQKVAVDSVILAFSGESGKKGLVG